MKTPSHHRYSRPTHRRAFSLVEILVAMVVAGLLVLLLNQLLTSSNRGISLSNKRLDNSSIGRSAFDRIAYDFSSIIQLNQAGSFITKNTGNDAFTFFARVRGSSNDSRFSKLHYSVNAFEDKIPSLLRSNNSVGWDDDPLAAASSVGENIGSGIFRLELAFLGKNGSLSITPPSPPDSLYAIIVAFAVIEPQALALLSEAQLSALANRLEDVVDGETPIMAWDVESFADLPNQIRENIRFYERAFYVR